MCLMLNMLRDWLQRLARRLRLEVAEIEDSISPTKTSYEQNFRH